MRGLGDWPRASQCPQNQPSGRFGRPAASHPRPSPGLSPRAGRGARGAVLPLSPPFAGRGRVRGLGDWPRASQCPQNQPSGPFGRPAATLSAPHPTSPRWAGRGARGAGLPLSPPFAGRGRVRGGAIGRRLRTTRNISGAADLAGLRLLSPPLTRPLPAGRGEEPAAPVFPSPRPSRGEAG